MNYLLKTEPSEYSFADLQEDRETVWDGVSNPVAVRNLREMKSGAKLIIYHTGDERTAVGTAAVVSVDAKDPKNPRVLYAAGFEGNVWRSADRGVTWQRVPGYDFKWGHRVIFDPYDAKTLYVTTFGGSVWSTSQ